MVLNKKFCGTKKRKPPYKIYFMQKRGVGSSIFGIVFGGLSGVSSLLLKLGGMGLTCLGMAKAANSVFNKKSQMTKKFWSLWGYENQDLKEKEEMDELAEKVNKVVKKVGSDAVLAKLGEIGKKAAESSEKLLNKVDGIEGKVSDTLDVLVELKDKMDVLVGQEAPVNLQAILEMQTKLGVCCENTLSIAEFLVEEQLSMSLLLGEVRSLGEGVIETGIKFEDSIVGLRGMLKDRGSPGSPGTLLGDSADILGGQSVMLRGDEIQGFVDFLEGGRHRGKSDQNSGRISGT